MGLMRLLNIIASLPKQIFKEGLKVMLYRTWKLGRVHYLGFSGQWSALERRAYEFWADGAVERWLNTARNGQMLITKEHSDTFGAWLKSNAEWELNTRAYADKIVHGDITILVRNTILTGRIFPGTPTGDMAIPGSKYFFENMDSTNAISRFLTM